MTGGSQVDPHPAMTGEGLREIADGIDAAHRGVVHALAGFEADLPPRAAAETLRAWADELARVAVVRPPPDDDEAEFSANPEHVSQATRDFVHRVTSTPLKDTAPRIAFADDEDAVVRPPRDAGHRYTLHIDTQSVVGLKVECNYDPADETRPCWPHSEAGERETAPQADCMYVDWATNVDADDIIWGELDIEVDVEPKWRDDYMEFHLLGLAEFWPGTPEETE